MKCFIAAKNVHVVIFSCASRSKDSPIFLRAHRSISSSFFAHYETHTHCYMRTMEVSQDFTLPLLVQDLKRPNHFDTFY